jgi:hypothetical protein
MSALVLLAGTIVLHAACLRFFPKAELDPWGLSDFYPLSVFLFRRPAAWQALLGLAELGAFAWAWPRLERESSLARIFVAGLVLAVASNLLLGWRYGIDYPTTGWGDGGIEYYQDAILVKGPLWLLQRFNAVQFDLLEHARTHPPGPVLLYWALHLLLRDPGLVSIGVTAVFLGLVLDPLRRLLRQVYHEEPVGALLLFCALPASLIYGLATVDAVIAGLFLRTVAAFVEPRGRLSSIRAAFWLALSLFFTFGALFLLPVLSGFELFRRRSLRRSLSVLAGACVALGALKVLTGFDWAAAFLKASAMENEKGFLLLADPRRYGWYRIGAVAEILFYFTPFLCLLAWRGRAALKAASEDGWVLAWLGPATLAAMLLSGAMKVGEAARICIFIVPFLLLPAMAAFKDLDAAGRRRVAMMVFGWGTAMQLFGFYQW